MKPAAISRSTKMNRNVFITAFAAAIILAAAALNFAQPGVPTATLVNIIKAEDHRDAVPLIPLLSSPSAQIRERAALALGRIGREDSVPALINLAEQDASPQVREMAVFALGEIESETAANALIAILDAAGTSPKIRAAAVEAAGKLAASAPNGTATIRLRTAIAATLSAELKKGVGRDRETASQALTAALRARPENTATVIAGFLADADAGIRADAANALGRLRSKEAAGRLRSLAEKDEDQAVRIFAIRAYAAAGDNAAAEVLRKIAVADNSPAIRIAAVRGLASIKDKDAAAALIGHGRTLLGIDGKGLSANKNELLEIAAVLGQLLAETENADAAAFFEALRKADGFRSSETETAFAAAAPQKYLAAGPPPSVNSDPWAAAAYAAGLRVIAESKNDEIVGSGRTATMDLIAKMQSSTARKDERRMLTALPDVMRTLIAYKPDNQDEILRSMLENEDVFLRAGAAELIAERPYSQENFKALTQAFSKSQIIDRMYDDALLAILNAAFKLNKNESAGIIIAALTLDDKVVRDRAFALAKQIDTEQMPGMPTLIEAALDKKMDQVHDHASWRPRRLGQVLNTAVDYRRAAARRNGKAAAEITTNKGKFTIELLPEDAPLTVDNFIKLAQAGYFNGKLVHRVVPNFVMQDGDPRGDGNGGPGWTIRCEVNRVRYGRGTVGMALSGKDTGGSQWFATHTAQPHLDGGYTVFGHIDETGMKVVDKIARGDRITSVRILQR